MKRKFYVKAGETIKELRLKNNMTQQEVADKLKINRSAYSNYESGFRSFDIDTMIKICDLFNVDINSFTSELRKYIGK